MNSSSVQVISENWWITKVAVPLFGIIIASVIIPLLLHLLKYSRERKERFFEARKEAYKEYFKIIECAASNAWQEYEKFSLKTMPEAFQKLLQSDNSPETIVKFQQILGDFTIKIQKAYQKSTEESTNLKILCSKQLLEIMDKFENLNKKLLNKSTEWLAELKTAMINPDMEATSAKEMQKIGEDIQVLKKQIICQMRKEVGSDDF